MYAIKSTKVEFNRVKLIKFMKYYALNNIMLGFEKLSGHRLIQQTNITSNSILSNDNFGVPTDLLNYVRQNPKCIWLEQYDF